MESVQEIFTRELEKIFQQEFNKIHEVTIEHNISILPEGWIENTVYMQNGKLLSREGFQKILKNYK